MPTLPEVKQPLPSPAPSEKPEKQPWIRPLLKSTYLPIAATCVVILGLIILVTLVAHRRRSWEGWLDIDVDGAASTPQKLMGSAGDQEYDLGEEENIDTLIIGKSPASAIPLPDDDEHLQDEHIKIMRLRHGYRIKNLAEQPIVVDGTAVKRGSKLDLVLPATIDLTQQSRITLSRVPVLEPEHQMQTMGESHETDDI